MSSETICDSCGSPIEQDERFCGACGTAVQAAAAPAAGGGSVSMATDATLMEAEPEHAVSPSMIAAMAEMPESTIAPIRLSPTPMPAARKLRLNSEPGAPRPAPAYSPDEGDDSQSACKHLQLRYNANRQFLAGSAMPLNIEITPCVDGIKELFIGVESRDNGICQGKRLLHSSLSRAHQYPVNVDVLIPHASRGLLTFSLFVCYKYGDSEHWYFFEHAHAVYGRDESTSSVIHKIEINAGKQVQQGHAGDIHMHDDYSGMAEMLRQAQGSSMGQLERQLMELPKRYVWKTLHECSPQPELFDQVIDRPIRRQSAWVPFRLPNNAPPPLARVQKLTLHTDDFRLHVFAGSEVSLGRNRDNTFVVRCFDRYSRLDVIRSRSISQTHCRLKLDGHSCFLFDGGSRASTGGTFLSDVKVPFNAPAPLPVNRPAVVSLGRIGNDDVLTLTAEFHCGANDEPQYMILRRNDCLSEAYLVLWATCRIDLVVPEFGALHVAAHQGGFAGGTADLQWLVPGMQVPGGNVMVQEFEQYNFSAVR